MVHSGRQEGVRSEGFARLAALSGFAALLLALGLCGYFIVNLNAELRDLGNEVARLEERFEALPQKEMRQELDSLKAELEDELRGHVEQLLAQVQSARAAALSAAAPEDVPAGETAADPAAAAAGEAVKHASYSFELIQVTQFNVQDGQEVIYTKKSNLLQFFSPDRAMRIVATHMFQVWQDYYLLVIFRD